MTPPHAVAVRDALRWILHHHPIEMTAPEIARHLDHQLVATPYGMQRRKLTPAEVYHHCADLALGGYLTHLEPDEDRDLPARFMWRPPEAGGHRGVEAWEAEQFEALAALAGDKGQTR